MSIKTYQSEPMTVRCRAFSGEPIRDHRVMVDERGTVRVYDSVAGHYTVCTSLSPATERRIRRMAQVSL